MGSFKKNNESQKKEAILTFAREHGRRPSQVKPGERQLWVSMHSYVSQSNTSYDHEFSRILETIAPARVRDPKAKKAAILAFAKEHGRRPSRSRPEEKHLGKTLSDYIWSKSDSYDPEFCLQLYELVPSAETVSQKKEAIIAFVKEHGRRPSQTKPGERKLGLATMSYASPSHTSYDPEFARQINELAPRVDAASLNKEAILAFVKEHGRRPSQIKPEEKRLGIAACIYLRPTHKNYDPEFEKRLIELGKFQVRKFNPALKKEAIIAFVKEHGRRPSLKIEEEKKLAMAAVNYTAKSCGSYDQKFTILLNKLAPLAPKIDTVSLNKEVIIAFVKKHGRKPRPSRTEEKKLGQAANNYTRSASSSFDPDFKAKLDALLKKGK